MKLSKKAEYALRALTAMGRESAGRTFSIHDLAEKERIPLKFLEQILLSLKNGGILRSKRGVGGGYQMQLPPAEITLRQVIELIDGPFQPIPCCEVARAQSGSCDCGAAGGCGLGRTLLDLQRVVHDWLDSTTIARIIERGAPPQALNFEI
jgi:Rrf2 family transcriptional regulator, iron-sulfur cluster assembly transcription factor